MTNSRQRSTMNVRVVSYVASLVLFAGAALVVFLANEMEPSLWAFFVLPLLAAAYAGGVLPVALEAAAATLLNLWFFFRLATSSVAVNFEEAAIGFYSSMLVVSIGFLTGMLVALLMQRVNRERERARRVSLVDRLTGLRNYAYFMDRLTEERERADRRDRELSLIMLDIDRFKDFNDRFGHLSGNQLLQNIARIITDCVRADDIVARYGGEEFAIILPDTPLETAVEVAERIRKKIESQFFFGDRRNPRVRKTISAGVAAYPAQADDEIELIDRADRALYMAKQEGRNRVVCYSDLVEEKWLRRMRVPS
jgi:diguanylate cyclase (GGDEF)-like protein